MNPRTPQLEDHSDDTPLFNPAGRPRRGAVRNRRQSNQAFSLVELLVVVAVIGTLVSMLLPAVNGALEGAAKANVHAETQRIKAAIDAYYSVYGETPMPSNMHTGWAGDWTGYDYHSKWPILALSGVHHPDYPNPREISFLEISTGKDTHGNTDDPWGVSDPWGNSYRIRWDCTYDNKVTINPNGTGNKTYNVRAIVYSHGPNGIWGGGDDIFSID